jgi:vacuolar-type H+-ATPase subunit I/STV1
MTCHVTYSNMLKVLVHLKLYGIITNFFSGYILFCSLVVSVSQLMSETISGSFDERYMYTRYENTP